MKGSRAQNTKNTLNLKTQAKPVDNFFFAAFLPPKRSSLRSRRVRLGGVPPPKPSPAARSEQQPRERTAGTPPETQKTVSKGEGRCEQQS